MSSLAPLLSRRDRSVQGVLLCVLAYAFIALQDATVKWLVASHSVVEILFWRSFFITTVCLVIGRKALLHQAWYSLSKPLLLRRGLLSICAWMLYYTAARDMSLAQMTTLYFSAPIMVTVLAALILKERATRWQWFAVLLGFVGVTVASRPSGVLGPWPVALTLLAALCWAFTYIQMRTVDKATPVLVQVFVTSLVFLCCTAVALPWHWTPGIVTSPALWGMFGAGVVGGLGQFFLFSSFSRATATLLAPFEYTGLIWAFILSSVIWGTHLELPLLIGAGLIALSGTLAMLGAARRPREVATQNPET